ncbi:uncharacterized protein LOC132306755 [Cornus florida]|uniref:uncharacterized protein LOC132306755 n=1 Tax=Cornus florida TaxID=4283 RepID=UPI00289F7EF5|nr:uncharacterized protein LOC132306755 [Cornus florida]
MAAAVTLQLLRPKHRTIGNPNFIHFFSSSISDPNAEDQNTTSSTPSQPQPQPQSQSQPHSSFSSYFSDVRSSLKQSPPPPQQRQPRKPFSPSSSTPNTTKVASFEEIRKNLAEFRRRSSVPPPGGQPSPPQSQSISFQELYKRNVISTGEGSNTAEANKGTKLTFDAIRESLRQIRTNTPKQQGNGDARRNDSMSLSSYKEVLNTKRVYPNANKSTTAFERDELPSSVFEREMNVKKDVESSAAMKTEFVKMYGYDELGEKLRRLRPATKGGSWFSLGELNERLMKLREIEEKETDSNIGGVKYKDLRESLQRLKFLDAEKTKKASFQKLNVLGQLAGPPTYMLSPPKEMLVEKYFHPDNMSSAEKLKLELKKVRDEFKLSESDCGSTPVQVAQLTTKIKYLSTSLHKKDKHSRKGLQGMIQRRKKLLKYLRRTEWDTYCHVLSKLGLRDNPDYKNIY